jgi:long-chain fatty acid transport protein
VLQKFEAYGTQGFSGQSAAPAALSNNGKDTSTGIGIRLGYMGKLSDTVSVGASFSPEISMSRMDKYAGLFADQGKFNIPANYGVGAAFQVSPSVQLAVDHPHQLQQGGLHQPRLACRPWVLPPVAASAGATWKP